MSITALFWLIVISAAALFALSKISKILARGLVSPERRAKYKESLEYWQQMQNDIDH